MSIKTLLSLRALHLLHCFSAKDKNEKKFLGFSFFFLMDADETTIKDGSHVLCVYKCEDPAKMEVRIRSFSSLFFRIPFPVHCTYFCVSPPQMALLGFFHINSLLASSNTFVKPKFTGQQVL